MAKEFRQIEWDAALEDDLRQLIRLAVREDLECQLDWTTVALVEPDDRGQAAVVARQAGVMAGLRAIPVLLDEMQADIVWEARSSDGEQIDTGGVVGTLAGSARDLLTCERPLLNLFGRLSGIATVTRQYVDAVAGTGASIYDTRKTTPGWRRLEKYAVRCGGGKNHRTGLYDAILIKDNHLALAAGQGLPPAAAVARAREFLSQMAATAGAAVDPRSMIIEVEVEVDTLDRFSDVLAIGPDIILLDNMDPATLRKAIALRARLAPQIELEASGGVTLAMVRAIAETGIDRISVGALTHSPRSLDVALDWQQAR